MSDDNEPEVAAEPQAEQETAQAVSEPEQESQEPKQVPIDAMLAERRKRQDAEQKAAWLEQQMSTYQQQQQQAQAQTQQDDDDPYTKEIKSYVSKTVQEHTKSALEKQYLVDHPDCADRIKNDLAPIINKKPWLAQSIQGAENRYARAMEIIEDYSPRQAKTSDGEKRLQENQMKPGSPASAAKTSSLSKMERLNSMSRKEFSEYRASLLGRRPNIRGG